MVEETAEIKRPILDNKERSYATGTRPVLQMIVNQPLEIIQSAGNYDVKATVKGGGLSGQAGALRHGISKALIFYDMGFRQALKKVGFLTRDSRVVERKKSGLAKARRSYQFSKR